MAGKMKKTTTSTRNKRNKRQGDRWNYRVLAFIASHLGLVPFNNKNHKDWEVATAKAMAKGQDGMGIDVVYRDNQPRYVKRLLIQNKKTLSRGIDTKAIDIQPLLDVITTHEDDIPLLFTQVTRDAGSRETTVCELVTVKMKDFAVFLEAYKIVNNEKKI